MAFDVEAAVHGGVHELDEFLAQESLDVLGRARADHFDPFAEGVHELHRRLGAEVGQQEGLLHLVPDVLVDLVRGEQRQQALAEDVVGLDQAFAQPGQAAGHGQRGLHRNGFQTRDVVRHLDRFQAFEVDGVRGLAFRGGAGRSSTRVPPPAARAAGSFASRVPG